jgi:hypothetical protein
VVQAWAAGYKQDGQVDRHVLGFHCVDASNPVEGLVVRCTHSGRRVTFYANVP